MMTRRKPVHQRQRGAATLLMALALMMAISVMTLAVARSQLMQQKVAANEHWNTRLLLEAESALAQGVMHLNQSLGKIDWQANPKGADLINHLALQAKQAQVETDVLFAKSDAGANHILIQARARRADGSKLSARVSQYLRPLSLLSPLAESAPPLVVKGCIESPLRVLPIRPINSGQAQPGTAAWVDAAANCPATRIDPHGGALVQRPMGEDLWTELFSIRREQFDALVQAERNTPEPRRHYWIARRQDLNAGRWTRSLGSVQQPIVLYFPPALGCPGFAAGVRIHGAVFIDAPCGPPGSAPMDLEIYGLLVVNGDLYSGNAKLRINHIQIAAAQHTKLRFPALRTLRVPGSWRDF